MRANRSRVGGDPAPGPAIDPRRVRRSIRTGSGNRSTATDPVVRAVRAVMMADGGGDRGGGLRSTVDREKRMVKCSHHGADRRKRVADDDGCDRLPVAAIPGVVRERKSGQV